MYVRYGVVFYILTGIESNYTTIHTYGERKFRMGRGVFGALSDELEFFLYGFMMQTATVQKANS